MTPSPSDGARCAVATCGDWQLLPVRCDACHALYCSAHAAAHAHGCAAAAAAAAAYTAIACPACGVALLPPAARSEGNGGFGSAADAAVAAHLDAGCPSGRGAVAAARATAAAAAAAAARGGAGGRGRHAPGAAVPPPSTPYTRCARAGCHTRTPVAVACGGCGRDYCIAHRLEADHGCVGRPAAAAGGGGGRGGRAASALAAAGRRGGAAQAAAVAAARTVRPHERGAVKAATPAAVAAVGAGAAAAATARRPRPSRPPAGAPTGAPTVRLAPRNTPASAVAVAATGGDTLTVCAYLPPPSNEAPLYVAVPLRATVGVALDGLEAALPAVAAARAAAGARRWGVWAVGPAGGVARLPHMGVASALVAARALGVGYALVVDAPEAATADAAEVAPLPARWTPYVPALAKAAARAAAGGGGGSPGARSGLSFGRAKKDGLAVGGKATGNSACRVS